MDASHARHWFTYFGGEHDMPNDVEFWEARRSDSGFKKRTCYHREEESNVKLFLCLVICGWWLSFVLAVQLLGIIGIDWAAMSADHPLLQQLLALPLIGVFAAVASLIGAAIVGISVESIAKRRCKKCRDEYLRDKRREWEQVRERVRVMMKENWRLQKFLTEGLDEREIWKGTFCDEEQRRHMTRMFFRKFAEKAPGFAAKTIIHCSKNPVSYQLRFVGVKEATATAS